MMKSHDSSPPRRAAADGFILIAVLWILGALAVLASIYSVFVVETATAIASHTDRVRAESLVVAGLELTAYRITAIPQQRPSNGAFSFRSGPAGVAVGFRSETARIDLNHAPKELLTGLFASLGALREAESYADRIIGWRTPSAERQDEAAAYRTAGMHYGPRGGAFPHVGELWLVMGLPEAVIERALPHLTVYSTQPQVSVLDASAQVLAALPGMSPERLHGVLAEREAAPQNAQTLLSMLGPAQTHATAEPGKAFRVTVQIVLDNGRRMRSEVVILVPEEDREPYRILSWNDDVDEPAGAERVGAERVRRAGKSRRTMTRIRAIVDGVLCWIDGVAATIVALAGWFGSRRTVQLVEDGSGFLVAAGGGASPARAVRLQIRDGKLIAGDPSHTASLRGRRVELMLQPDRFLFRPLELPKRAAEFLDGIVRAQIDRLTPWTANEAVVGWSTPQADGPDRIVVTVAATVRTLITPYVQAFAAHGVRSVAVSTRLPDGPRSGCSTKQAVRSSTCGASAACFSPFCW